MKKAGLMNGMILKKKKKNSKYFCKKAYPSRKYMKIKRANPTKKNPKIIIFNFTPKPMLGLLNTLRHLNLTMSKKPAAHFGRGLFAVSRVCSQPWPTFAPRKFET